MKERKKERKKERNQDLFPLALSLSHSPRMLMKQMAASLSFAPNRAILRRNSPRVDSPPPSFFKHRCWRPARPLRLRSGPVALAGSRADDPAPFEMSVENALKLLGVSEGASFDDILRAKNSILASCKDDEEAVAQVEAAYDMLLMQSLTQRRAGKVENSNVRYADVKPTRLKNAPITIESPTGSDLGIQAGVYGALMVLTYANGTSAPSPGTYSAADVPGLILATSFGASLYFLTKKNVKLGKATVITVGGLVVGAVVGSAVENWLQVDIVPFLGVHSPAAVVSEFILLSQFLVSLYVR
ncbi:hypothetical protein Scep_000253 [Stephania cephalantha]|uniref:Protein CHAPERONE-LIKE PROTEIN OF POR1, chloroplastic n=1 Tax=Stephania cephalantha TaxID=152367 RepID=A0AAP0L781_9MAGN